MLQRWEWRRALDFGLTREQWLESIPAKDYQELLELSEIEPVGSDALVQQMAVVAQAMAGGKLTDYLVLSTYYDKSPEELARMMGWKG